MGIVMIMHGKQFLRFNLLVLLAATVGQAQAPSPGAAGQDQGVGSTARLTQRPEDGRGQPLFRKITAINKGSFELAKPDGSTVTVKFTDKTEYRTHLQGAKLSDFKVGDVV